jgi:hypothetical protein
VTQLRAHRRVEPTTDVPLAWRRCTDPETMCALLQLGDRVGLWCYEANVRRDARGRVNDFVFAILEQGVKGRPSRVRLEPEGGADVIRTVVPEVPDAARWNEAFAVAEGDWARAPALLLNDFLVDARTLGTLPPWVTTQDLLESAFLQCNEQWALVTLLEFVGDPEPLVSAARALASVREPRRLNLVGPMKDERAGAAAIHRALDGVTVQATGRGLRAVKV